MKVFSSLERRGQCASQERNSERALFPRLMMDFRGLCPADKEALQGGGRAQTQNSLLQEL